MMKNERIACHNGCPEKHQQTIKLALFLLLSTCQLFACACYNVHRCMRACMHPLFQAIRIKKEIMMMRIFAHLHSLPLAPLFFSFFLSVFLSFLILFIHVNLLTDHRPLDLKVCLIIQGR